MHLASRGRFDLVNISRGQFDKGFISKRADLTFLILFSGADMTGSDFGKGSNYL